MIWKFRKYKGLTGTIKYDKKEKMYYGELYNLEDIISYRAHSLIKLRKKFKTAVNWYLGSGLVR